MKIAPPESGNRSVPDLINVDRPDPGLWRWQRGDAFSEGGDDGWDGECCPQRKASIAACFCLRQHITSASPASCHLTGIT